ncbi:hypothetical protein CLOHYLEM_04634 [[Clostridium] hylemonae DSM 15053]|uniref:Uncharacterized protein n=1 Tax=[Clostridium] hylemonae DSM 15053 TaxID=553973 RepID=C0BXU7_9FIRM|nr:hypothetical protein CLOHYLEM_04634 [[Clostridium] hylemonae DSM 15053]
MDIGSIISDNKYERRVSRLLPVFCLLSNNLKSFLYCQIIAIYDNNRQNVNFLYTNKISVVIYI